MDVPYCNRDATITHFVNANTLVHFFENGNKSGFLGLQTVVIVCPNPDCRDFEIKAALFKAINVRPNPNAQPVPTIDGAALFEWRLKPKSSSKTFPTYIPKPILDDYYEACLIVNDSPKASATLSRRCLQGMIRDFWNVTKQRLIDEIEAIKGQIDTTTWEAIDAVRGIGNIECTYGERHQSYR